MINSSTCALKLNRGGVKEGRLVSCMSFDLDCSKYDDYDGRGLYFFVDNAQMLRRKSMNFFVKFIRTGNVFGVFLYCCVE